MRRHLLLGAILVIGAYDHARARGSSLDPSQEELGTEDT